MRFAIIGGIFLEATWSTCGMRSLLVPALGFMQALHAPRHPPTGKKQTTTTNQPMKSIIALVAAVLTLAISGCAHKPADAACHSDGKCCKKK